MTTAPDPWSDLLPEATVTAPFTPDTMLRLIAYDISDPARLRRIAEACADYGVRVQKSLFECWLEEDRFEQLWSRLVEEMDEERDSIAAYVLDRGCTPRRRRAGRGMVFTHHQEGHVL